LFGGCLLKELDASKGYLGDANVSAWSDTVEKVKKEYPDVKIVIRGMVNMETESYWIIRSSYLKINNHFCFAKPMVISNIKIHQRSGLTIHYLKKSLMTDV
jgi:hypothetical protein